jgi:acyl carrier protein
MTDQPSIIDTVIVVISEQSDQPVTADTTLDSIGLDSLDMVSIMIALEEELHLSFPLEYDPSVMSTVQDVADHILARLNQAAP